MPKESELENFDCPFFPPESEGAESGLFCIDQRHCPSCGHNPIEAARRRAYIEANGLTVDPDGLRRLHLSNMKGADNGL